MRLRRNTTIDRSDYAARQAELLDALMRGDRFPSGFDVAKADAAGSVLRRKRARAVRRAWPALSTALGSEYDREIDEYLRTHASSGAGLTDGLAFAGSLGLGHGNGHVARVGDREDVRVEILLAGAATRRAFAGMRWLGRPRRLIVVLRAPGLGLRVRCLPLGRPDP